MVQAVHTLTPNEVENVPTGHAEHIAEETAPTAVEKVAPPQEKHMVDDMAPKAVEYVPGVHD
jgi:hypothetical protein